MPTIRFTNRLDRHVDCPTEIVGGDSVLLSLREYFAKHEKVEGYVLDKLGKLRTHMTIFVDATGDFLVMGSTTGGVFVTNNGGEHLECITSHLPQIYAVQIG